MYADVTRLGDNSEEVTEEHTTLFLPTGVTLIDDTQVIELAALAAWRTLSGDDRRDSLRHILRAASPP